MLTGGGNLNSSYFFCMRSSSEVWGAWGIGLRLRELMSFVLNVYTVLHYQQRPSLSKKKKRTCTEEQKVSYFCNAVHEGFMLALKSLEKIVVACFLSMKKYTEKADTNFTACLLTIISNTYSGSLNM